MSAKVIQLIEVFGVAGKGTTENPFRTTRELYELDGTFIYRYDPFVDLTKAEQDDAERDK